jgi:hypothetical protein
VPISLSAVGRVAFAADQQIRISIRLFSINKSPHINTLGEITCLICRIGYYTYSTYKVLKNSFIERPKTMSNLSAVTIEESGDTKIITANGVEVEIGTNGDVMVHTAGHLNWMQPIATNDAAQNALKVGDEIRENGVVTAIYVGRTADGKLILAMPTDLDVTMIFNDAAAAVETLNDKNNLGHNDWKIPTLENARVLQKNQNEGALKGTFKTASASGSDFPAWYWSSTPSRDYPTDVGSVSFSGGSEGWFYKDHGRLSCRPVRLVPVGAL